METTNDPINKTNSIESTFRKQWNFDFVAMSLQEIDELSDQINLQMIMMINSRPTPFGGKRNV